MNKKLVIILGIVIVVILVICGVFLFNKPANHTASIDINSIQLDNLQTEQEKELFEEVKVKLLADPQDVDAMINLAQLQKWNGSFPDGIETLKIAKQLNHDNLTIYNNLADLYIIAKNYDQAEKELLELLAINSQWINAYLLLSTIYEDKMPEIYNSDKYSNLLKKGQEEDIGVNTLTFLQLLGNYYRNTEDKTQAIKYYQEYLAIDPSAANIAEEIRKME